MRDHELSFKYKFYEVDVKKWVRTNPKYLKQYVLGLEFQIDVHFVRERLEMKLNLELQSGRVDISIPDHCFQTDFTFVSLFSRYSKQKLRANRKSRFLDLSFKFA